MASDRSPLALKPHDVVVALQLLISPDATFRDLAKNVGLSVGETHNATQRLEIARLILPDRGPVNRRALLEFLVHGVPYAFPAERGPETRGIPTAHSGPILNEMLESYDQVVWPSARGTTRAPSISPLCPGAIQMPVTNPQLYQWLTVVDALRVGRSRERKLAQNYLSEVLLGSTPE